VQAPWIALTAFILMAGGVWLGDWLRRVLPKEHLSEASRDIVRIGIGFLATMAALILGLLLASAKTSYDTKSEELRGVAAKLISLDRTLRQYGPAADPIRAELSTSLSRVLSFHWGGKTIALPTAGSDRGPIAFETLQQKLFMLPQSTPAEAALAQRALSLTNELTQTRWLLIEQTGGNIPWPFLIPLICWLALIFSSFSLFAPRNATVYATMLLCALSVASALFLIIEMDQPYGGVFRISAAPLESALGYMQH
jgi:hypothetical protein